MKSIVLPLLLSISLFSCDTRIDPLSQKQVTIEKIKILSIPNTNDGSNWDEDNSTADIAIGIDNGEKEIYDSGLILANFNLTNSEITTIPTYTLPMVNFTYKLSLWDIDDSTKELIGSVDFNPNDNLLEEGIEIFSSDIKLRLYFKWGY